MLTLNFTHFFLNVLTLSSYSYVTHPLLCSFNHKTGAEDVHFTSVSSHFESDSDADNDDHVVANSDDNQPSTEHPHVDGEESSAASNGKNSLGGSDLESSAFEDVPTVLQMIMVNDVRAGAEVSVCYFTGILALFSSSLLLVVLVKRIER